MNVSCDLTRGCSVVCLSIIIIVTAIVYHAVLGVGFWTDDYAFIDAVGRFDLPDYLRLYFDPRLQWHWYRPMQGLQWWIAFQFFGSDARGHHLVQLGLHILNACLLFDLTRVLTQRWRVALIAALIYATLAVDSLAVAWVGVADPLAGVFYLLALRFWFNYLTRPHARWYVLTILALVGALFSKEVAAPLPFVLFLMDRWLVGKSLSPRDALKRYALFGMLLVIYGTLEWNVLTRGLFTQHLGYGIGTHIIDAFVHHLATLAFPWGLPVPLNWIWLGIVIVVLGVTIWRYERRLAFLVAVTLLALAPILPFQFNMASAPRYLYLPFMGSAVMIALSVERARVWLARPRATMWLGTLFGTMLIVWHGTTIAEQMLQWEGTVRQTRLQFRPIFQAHPTFPNDTLLYFLNPPMQSPYISGLMYLRYGREVKVHGVDLAGRANLRDHNAAFVYYYDEMQRWHEFPVARTISARVTLDLPARFGEQIALEGIELTRDEIRRGEAFVVIAYWHALARIEKDYTVFAHLVDTRGEIIASTDTLLLQNDLPTSRWRANDVVPHGIIIHIEPNVPLGEYRLLIGLYELATMQRLPLDSTALDHITIAPIRIVER
ncbi:MAG: hypothetical protein N2559_12595 [Anaerolineae bacterium]|nr:hypothetical protein [Anaerolineae bacterium]